MPTQKPTWEERLEMLFEETGKYYIAHGSDYRAVGNGGKTWKDQHKIVEDFIRQELQQERERIVEKTNDLGFISNNQKEQLSKELELLDEAQKQTKT